MKIEFKRANVHRDVEALMAMDREIYLPHDCWDPEDFFERYIIYWVLSGNERIGWIAFEHGTRFTDGTHWRKARYALYLANNGILKNYQVEKVLDAVVQFEIAYAHSHGFKLISTNERVSNKPTITALLRAGFTVAKRTEGYWEAPNELNIVLEYIF